MMRLLTAGLLVSLLIFASGCASGNETPILSPAQVTSAMVGSEITVKGRIEMVVVNPGGLGGIYLLLGKGEVGVRIQEYAWSDMDAVGQAVFRAGKTIIVSGELVRAGEQLVIFHGVSMP